MLIDEIRDFVDSHEDPDFSCRNINQLFEWEMAKALIAVDDVLKEYKELSLAEYNIKDKLPPSSLYRGLIKEIRKAIESPEDAK